MLNMKKNSLLILIIALGFTGCSTSPTIPQAPIEDQSASTEQSEQRDLVIVSPVPDDSRIASQQDIDETSTTANKPIVPVSPSVIEPSKQNAAVVALLDSAQQHKLDGDLRSAQTSLQRAQRIAPRDPEVYFALANTHRDLQNYALAEQVALKGVSIVQGQPAQLQHFWILIADIRLEAGNFSGAEKAKEMANRY
jgi:Flp pilus assembly protein TadD